MKREFNYEETGKQIKSTYREPPRIKESNFPASRNIPQKAY